VVQVALMAAKKAKDKKKPYVTKENAGAFDTKKQRTGPLPV